MSWPTKYCHDFTSFGYFHGLCVFLLIDGCMQRPTFACFHPSCDIFRFPYPCVQYNSRLYLHGNSCSN